MQRWKWTASVSAVALTLTVAGIVARPKPTEAQAGRRVIAIDFSKLIRGRAATGVSSESECHIKNGDGTVTERTTDVQSGIKISADIRPSHCDETPSTGGLDGTFEAEVSGFEKRSASGGDVPPRPAADQPTKDNRGVFKGKWQIRNKDGVVVARGELTLFLHVNTHYEPPFPAAVDDCFVPGQLEGVMEGTATVGDHKGGRISASLGGNVTSETPAGANILLAAEGLVIAPCHEEKDKKAKE
jgi:hypothetical protein